MCPWGTHHSPQLPPHSCLTLRAEVALPEERRGCPPPVPTRETTPVDRVPPAWHCPQPRSHHLCRDSLLRQAPWCRALPGPPNQGLQELLRLRGTRTWRKPAVWSEAARVEGGEAWRLGDSACVPHFSSEPHGSAALSLWKTLSPGTCPRNVHTLVSIPGGPGSCLEFFPLLPSCLYGWWQQQGSVGERS